MRNFALIALLATSVPARAAQELAVRVSTEFAGDSGLYATGGSKSFVQGEIGYAHTVRSFRFVQLWLEGSLTVGQRSDKLFDTWSTSLVAEQLTVGLRATFPVLPWLVPQLRAGVGAVVGTLHIDGLQSGSFDQTHAGFTSYVLGGVELLVPRRPLSPRPHITAGLVLEAGYCFSTAMRYSLEPAANNDTVQIPSAPTNLGALSLSGALLRVGLLLRF